MELIKMTREKQILELEAFLKDHDREVTMILQSLQWDRKHLLEKTALVECQFNTNHRVPPDKLLEHEQACYLKSQGYPVQVRLLPSPLDPNASTLVKLSSDNIAGILDNASRCEAVFKRGAGCSGHQPLTADRLQATYTSDERRAIHAAVVSRAPSCHDLSDLALLSAKDESSQDSKAKSRLEALAVLRDMKRRRAKYHVASKTRNYSDVLRDVITTQMELYNQTQNDIKDKIKKEEPDKSDKTEDFERLPRNKDNDLNKRYQRNRAHSPETSKYSYNEHQYSRHSDEFDHRKRKDDDKYQSEKYSRAEKNYKSNHRKSDDDCDSRKRERLDKYSSSSTSRGERRKYNDDKEPYKRKYSHDIDHGRVHYIKKEKSGSEERSCNKSESSMRCDSQLNENHRETKNDCAVSKNDESGHKNNGIQKLGEVTIKKELDDNHDRASSSNDKAKDRTREHYDSKPKKRNDKQHDVYKTKNSRRDGKRHHDLETKKVVEKGDWSDDSAEIYHKTPKEKRESTKTENKDRYRRYDNVKDKNKTLEKVEACSRKQSKKSKHDKVYEDRHRSSRDHSSDRTQSRYREQSRR